MFEKVMACIGVAIIVFGSDIIMVLNGVPLAISLPIACGLGFIGGLTVHEIVYSDIGDK